MKIPLIIIQNDLDDEHIIKDKAYDLNNFMKSIT